MRIVKNREFFRKNKGKSLEWLYGVGVAKRMRMLNMRTMEEKVGRVRALELLKKKRACKGEMQSNWRGDDATICAKHEHIRKSYGKADHCDNPRCSGKSKKFEWSKKDHNTPYTRNIDEYQQLCNSCHQRYDKGTLMINGRYGWS